jgi:hypothetical protein
MSTATLTANSSVEQLLARIAELEAEKQSKQRTPELTFHVSEATGVIMVRGLGRFPLCSYFGQWTRFVAVIDKFRAFLEQVKPYVPQSKDESVDKAKLAKLPAGVVVTPKSKDE